MEGTGLFSWFSFLHRSNVQEDGRKEFNDEELETLRMISGFEEAEIVRIRRVYAGYCGLDNQLRKDVFVGIDWVSACPLKDRLLHIFGFNEHEQIDFQKFLEVVASFNSTGFGRREHKMRVAFAIQDLDGDGIISRNDLTEYLNRICGGVLSSADVEAVVEKVFAEASSDPKGDRITYADFQRVMAPTDFHIKLRLPI